MFILRETVSGHTENDIKEERARNRETETQSTTYHARQLFQQLGERPAIHRNHHREDIILDALVVSHIAENAYTQIDVAGHLVDATVGPTPSATPSTPVPAPPPRDGHILATTATLAHPIPRMERRLIRREHLSTPASRNLRLATCVTHVDLAILMTLVALMTGTPKTLMATLLHGVHPKKITMDEARMLRTVAVMMAVDTPPVRPRAIHAGRDRVGMRRQVRLRLHCQHGTVPKAPRSRIEHWLRDMRRMLVMKREIIAIQRHAREEAGKIARPLLILGV